MNYAMPLDCRACGASKPEQFAPSHRKRGTLCRLCSRQELMIWRRTSPRWREYQRERAGAARKFLDAYKMERGCSKCGYCAHPSALDFHHVDPSEKQYSVGLMGGGNWRLPKIKAEVAKCIILCANCHRIHTAEARKRG